jgi:choline dehydrogenase-like flavoprotein
LALAARLTENPDITVAVLEAGEHNIGESLIDVPGQFGQTFGNPKVFTKADNRSCLIICARSLIGPSLLRLKHIR